MISAEKARQSLSLDSGAAAENRSAKRRESLKRTLINLSFPLITIAVMLSLYALAAAIADESLILPKIGETLAEAGRLLKSALFYKSLAFTLLRSFIAFAAAFVIGSALGAAAYFSPTTEKLLSPLMVFLRAVPTMAVIFLLVLWFRSNAAPAIVAFTVLLPLSYTAAKNALESLDRGLFEMSRAYDVPRSRMFLGFILPQTAPPLIDSAAGNLSFSVKLTVAGEALAQSALGLGGILNLANVYIETARLMAVTLLAVVVCFILEGAVRLLKLPLKKWL